MGCGARDAQGDEGEDVLGRLRDAREMPELMSALTPGSPECSSGVMACGLRALLITTSLAATADHLALSDVLVVHALPGATRWIRGERYVGAISDEEEAR